MRLCLQVLKLLPFLVLIRPFPASALSEWKWVSGDYSENESLEQERAPTEGERSLPRNHPLVQRLQNWIDQLHQRLVEADAKRFAGIPKPFVRIYRDDKINGFVKSTFACHPMAVRLAPGSENSTKTVEILGLSPNFNLNSVIGIPPYLTLSSANKDGCHLQEDAQFESFISDLRKMSNVCPINFANGGLTGGPECMNDHDRKRLGSPNILAGYLGYHATLNVISISTGMINFAASEAEIVAVLYHEAGHYYHAHASTGVEPTYTFFYDLADPSNAGQPKPSRSLAKLGQRALEVGNSIAFWPIGGSRMSSSLSVFIGGFLRNTKRFPSLGFEELCAGDSNCLNQCNKLKFLKTDGLVGDALVVTTLGHAPSVKVQARYRELENQFFACADNIRLPLPGASEEESNNTIRGIFFPNLPGALSLILPKPELNSFGDLARLVDSWSKLKDQTLDEAAKAHLGYFTAEEDADRSSAIWMAKMGVNPVAGANLFLKLLKHHEEAWDRMRSGSPVTRSYTSYEDCQKYHASSWRKSDGSPVYLPVGSYSDPHHPSCFRVKNFDDISAAYGLASKTYSAETTSHSRWSEVLKPFISDLRPN